TTSLFPPPICFFRKNRRGDNYPDTGGLTEKDGGVMDFEGTVANCSKDPITHQFRVGVALSEPEADRREKGFLLQLQDRYRPVA
ncbi:hypothetical protein, partial [Pseudomonas putida]|uniref:hypothetical protein n=1 Tax=Pseudomonas putida TaxID=303 RepID=UPI001E43BF82